MSHHEHLGEHGRHLQPKPTAAPKPTNRRAQWLFGGLVALALLLLAVDHRAHLLGGLPWLFLLACPLMHLFMHGAHGHGHHRGGGAPLRERSPANAISSEREKHHD